jgi:hypothetical protein
MEIPMQKPAKKPAPKRSQKTAGQRRSAEIPPEPLGAASKPEEEIGKKSKQSRVIAMLRSPDGITISALMEATGWQPHSVRGFLAGMVRKKLRLKLNSTKVDGVRVYRIDHGTQAAAIGRHKRRAA